MGRATPRTTPGASADQSSPHPRRPAGSAGSAGETVFRAGDRRGGRPSPTAGDDPKIVDRYGCHCDRNGPRDVRAGPASPIQPHTSRVWGCGLRSGCTDSSAGRTRSQLPSTARRRPSCLRSVVIWHRCGLVAGIGLVVGAASVRDLVLRPVSEVLVSLAGCLPGRGEVLQHRCGQGRAVRQGGELAQQGLTRRRGVAEGRLVLAQARRAVRDGVEGLRHRSPVRTALGQQCCQSLRRLLTRRYCGRGHGGRDAAEDAGAAAGDNCPAGPLHIWPFQCRIRVVVRRGRGCVADRPAVAAGRAADAGEYGVWAGGWAGDPGPGLPLPANDQASARPPATVAPDRPRAAAGRDTRQR